MRRLSFVIVVLSIGLSSVVHGQKCRYDRQGQTDGPGGHILNEEIGPSVRFLSGTVVDPAGEPIIETVVVLKRIVGERKIYIGTAETNTNGYFCFGTLKPGQYILETGGRGFNPLWVTIRVVPNKSRVRRRWVRLVVPVGT